MSHPSLSRISAFLLFTLIFATLSPAFILLGDDTPPAPVQVEAQIAQIRLRINTGEIDGRRVEYPLLMYKDITYIPLTYNLCQALGLESSWERAYGLNVNPNPYLPQSPLKQDLLPIDAPDQVLGQPVSAVTATTAVYLAGQKIDNATQEWPLLVYRDITYLPLTWYFAHDLLLISYNFQGGPEATLSLQRPMPNVRIDAERMNQIVATAAIKLKNEALISTTSVTKNGYDETTIINRFDPQTQLVWQSVFTGASSLGQHLLSVTSVVYLPATPPPSTQGSVYTPPTGSTGSVYKPPTTAGDSVYGDTYGSATGTAYTPPSAPSVPGSVYGDTYGSATGAAYTPPSAPPPSVPSSVYAPPRSATADSYGVTTSTTKLYRSDDGRTWNSVDSVTYATYLPTPPKLPTFDLVEPVEGWKIQNDGSAWFFELNDMTLELQKDGTGTIVLYNYHFDIESWTLSRVIATTFPLLEGQPQSIPSSVTTTEVKYGEIKNVPKP